MKSFFYFLLFIAISCKMDGTKNEKRIPLQKIIEMDPSVKLEKEGELALMKGDYFQAVFKFRNALGYSPNDTLLYSKLMLAYEGSCKNGNEAHCDKGEEMIQKIELIQEFGIADTSTTVNDSVELGIMPANRLKIGKKK